MTKLVIHAEPDTMIFVGTTDSLVGATKGVFNQEVEPGEYIVQFGEGHESKFRLQVPVDGLKIDVTNWSLLVPF